MLGHRNKELGKKNQLFTEEKKDFIWNKYFDWKK